MAQAHLHPLSLRPCSYVHLQGCHPLLPLLAPPSPHSLPSFLPSPSPQDEDRQYLTELERWANIGPIVDFLVVDLERHGQGSLVTCSGAGKDGSLRTCATASASTSRRDELPIKGLWSVRSRAGLPGARLHPETRILAREEEELGEAELEGFDADRATVCCVSLPNGTDVCRVTTRGVRLIRGPDMVLADEWTPAGGAVSMAAAEKGMVLLATGGSTLHLLGAGADGKWRVLTSATMEHEVACLTICSAHQPDAPARYRPTTRPRRWSSRRLPRAACGRTSQSASSHCPI